MFSADEYQLVDFGAGRKLERFGPYLVDRPAPGASAGAPADPAAWPAAAARYDRAAGSEGKWTTAADLPSAWSVRWGQLVFELKLTEFGHLGLFPEHAGSWPWLADQIAHAGRELTVLNLFAYTGGATLAMAAAGARVVHVDSSRGTVAWARRNAEQSGLSAAPIRWIVEDAPKFVRRELARGNRYDAVVLDPPSYGHGPKGEPWKFEAGLPPLVRDCFELTRDRLKFLLLSCHTPGFSTRGAHDLFVAAAAGAAGHVAVAPVELSSTGGRRLSCGIAARWEN
ncbi:MAG TPA: class I SAM-dependent methyltransferase [Pirellulales bacterium]|jgi:23S rRNA (cytosine1962-C5)-methyltransferase|nr:class I SAM-dependent methyltransferase [Pirellulales bacterium]